MLEVFAFMLQKLGADVREGKRRQFNYIGNYYYCSLV